MDLDILMTIIIAKPISMRLKKDVVLPMLQGLREMLKKELTITGMYYIKAYRPRLPIKTGFMI